MEIKSYSTFPAITLPLLFRKKLLNVVWMKPGRGRIKTHNDVLWPKATAMLTCSAWTYCDECTHDFTMKCRNTQFF